MQQTPTPERYQEIQGALASRGYYRGTVDGRWDADSVDALRRFQADQNIPSDGRINSLSLIAMGLGPKRAVTGTPASPTTSSSTIPAQPAPSAAPAVSLPNPSPNPAETHP